MIRKHFILAGLLIASLLSHAQDNGFLYKHIYNGLKTVDFIFAFYPGSEQHFELSAGDTCTTFKTFTINKSTTELEWKDYKLRLQLKDGRQISSLNAKAKEGRLACTYNVPGKENHTQFYCFREKFTSDEIGNVSLVMPDDKFELEMYKADK